MTTAAWIILVVAIVLLLMFIWSLYSFFHLSRRYDEQRAAAISWTQKFYDVRDDRDSWKRRYLELEKGLVNEASDMDYIRDSLRRAADGDPTT